MKTPTATTRIQETRVRRLNDRGPAGGNYVLYWMQQSQRAEFNHALEYAVLRAKEPRNNKVSNYVRGRMV